MDQSSEEVKGTEEKVRSGKEEEARTLIKYGMTSGLVVEGEGAVVGETVMATWLEHVWFRHVPPTNFLLADSYHIHTAQQTQKILLEVRADKNIFAVKKGNTGNWKLIGIGFRQHLGPSGLGL